MIHHHHNNDEKKMDIEEESPSPNNPPSPDYDPTYPTYTKTVLREKLAPKIQEIAEYYYSDDEDKNKEWMVL